MKTQEKARHILLALVVLILVLTLGGASIGQTAERGDTPQVQEGPQQISILQRIWRRLLLIRLIRAADLIVLGQVSQVDSYRIDTSWGHNLIASDVTIQREETLKGQGLSTDSPITFTRLLGGTLDGITMHSSSTPFFRQRERTLLFLRRRQGDLQSQNAWEFLDADMGKFRVDEEGNVVELGMSWAQVRIEILSYLTGGRILLPLALKNFRLSEPPPGLVAAPATADLAPQLLFDPYEISWPGDSPVVKWRLHNPGFNDPSAGTVAEQNGAIRAGAREWNQRGRANFRFQYLGTTAVDKVENDGVNAVLVLNEANPTTVAECFSWYYEATLEYFEFDIVFYDASWVFDLGGIVGYNIEGTTAHEFGHALGLGHSAVPGSTMLAAGLVNEHRTLHLDDIDGIEHKYGARYSVYDQQPAGGNEYGDQFGYALAAGDFNGDGTDDLAVGAPFEDTTATDNGGVFIFMGQGGLDPLADPIFRDQTGAGVNEAGDEFGSALAVGDFNRDGYDDLAVGAPGEDYGATDAGGLFVFAGSAAGLGTPSFISQSGASANEERDHFGLVLATGDFNRDGYDDLAAGTPYENYDGAGNTGVVFIFWGSSGGLGSPELLHQGLAGASNEPTDHFGQALAVGDFDNDGYDDLAIGAPLEDRKATDDGVVFVFFGSSGGLRNGRYFGQEGAGSNETEDMFGWALAAADFNDDGYDDLAVGVPYEDTTADDNGVVFIFRGSATGPGNPYYIDQRSAGANEAGDCFGWVLAAGDFNADGTPELAIGTPFEDRRGVGDTGVVFIHQFSDDSASDTPYILFLEQPLEGAPGNNDRFGWALAVGEFNRIAGADLAIGVPGKDGSGSGAWAGQVHLWR